MIRRACSSDLKAVDSLLSQVLEVHAEGRPDIFKTGTRKYTDDQLLKIFEDDERPVFVYADDEGEVLGYAFCVIEEIRGENNLQDMKNLYIDDICVDERQRGRGIATELYGYVKEYAKKEGCYHITLNVWELNPGAYSFYSKMGMKPLKTVMEEILGSNDHQ